MGNVVLCFDMGKLTMNNDKNRFYDCEVNFYVTRQKKGHGSSFVYVGRTKRITSVVDAVFKHHPAVFGGEEKIIAWKQMMGELSPDREEFSKTELETIASLFYNKYYVDITIYKGVEATSDCKITSDEFRNTIVSDPGPNENQIYFLLGEIGCGKSAFINKLLTTYGKAWFTQKKILFIRVSAYYIKTEQMYLFSELVEKMLGKIIKIVKDAKIAVNGSEPVKKAFEKLLTLGSHIDDNIKILHIRNFIECLHAEGIRVLFVIDNIDYIFHIDDERAFLPEFGSSPLRSVNINIFLHLFRDSTKLGKLGVNVLLALRPDSYEVLKSIVIDNNEPYPDLYDDRQAYIATTPSMKEVVEYRIKMMREILESLPAGLSQEIFKTLIKPLQKFFYGGRGGKLNFQDSLLQRLPKLANHGLRDVVEFCARYAWLRGTNITHQGGTDRFFETGIDRFMEQYHAGFIAFMLKGYSRFSQKCTKFPNAYLVKEDVLDGRISIPNYYWIKWLLLQYIYLINEKKLTVKLQDILKIFCGTSGYPDIIVRCALSCLGRVHGPNVLRVNITCGSTQRVDLGNITLTERGQTCIETNVFGQFAYLQLAIEDNELPLPFNDKILELLGYDNMDYRYLVYTSEDYHNTLVPLIIRKAKQVLIFFELIKRELKYEQKRFPGAFERLKGMGIEINIKQIYDSLIGEIKSLFAYPNFKIADWQNTLAAIEAEARKVAEDVICPLYQQLESQVSQEMDKSSDAKKLG